MPYATIVVPAFNVEKTLAETLDALLVQTFSDFEILIVDDGSYDRTPVIAQDYAHDPRVRIVRQSNRGLAGARNTGIAEALGEVIGFCDSDDLWDPEKLAAHVRHLSQNPRIGLSFSASEMIDADGRSTGLFQRPRLTDITPQHMFMRNPVGNGSAPVIRREALRDIAFRPATETHRDWVFDETFAQSEDIECWMRLMLTTDWEVEGLAEPLTRYRVHGAGLSSNTERQLASWERMVTKLGAIAPDFVARHAPAARAYQHRYLARRAISGRDATRARQLVLSALRTSRHPLLHELAKTLTTLAAALVLSVSGGPMLALAETTLRRVRRS